MRIHSLADLRADLKVELRITNTKPRYTDEEIDLAIHRASNELREYFWTEAVDENQSFTQDVFEYVYSFPVENFYRIERIETSTPPALVEDWDESLPGTLQFYSNRGSGVIRAYYERHPVAYPDDLILDVGSGGPDSDDTSLAVTATTLSWPDTGYMRIEDEVLSYSAINRATKTFTVARGLFGSAAAAHSTADTAVSFVNVVDKEAFYDGVRDLASAYLNRMRIIDAPSADVSGNVTIMRQTLEGMNAWVRQHRMRSKATTRKQNRSKPLRSRRRGNA